jgi:hypothetical protein
MHPEQFVKKQTSDITKSDEVQDSRHDKALRLELRKM